MGRLPSGLQKMAGGFILSGMDFIPPQITAVFDWIYAGIVVPVFSSASRILEFVVLNPMDALKFPFWLEIVIIASLTAFLSLFIRKLLRIDEKEAAFQAAFLARKEAQELIKDIDDWKKQAVLYDASDEQLDEEFNTYLAQRFSRYGLTYLMPVFLVLFWLDCARPAYLLEERTGSSFAINLPPNSFGIPGISVPLLFLIVYLLLIAGYFKFRKKPKIDLSTLTRTQKG